MLSLMLANLLLLIAIKAHPIDEVLGSGLSELVQPYSLTQVKKIIKTNSLAANQHKNSLIICLFLCLVYH